MKAGELAHRQQPSCRCLDDVVDRCARRNGEVGAERNGRDAGINRACSPNRRGFAATNGAD